MTVIPSIALWQVLLVSAFQQLPETYLDELFRHLSLKPTPTSKNHFKHTLQLLSQCSKGTFTCRNFKGRNMHTVLSQEDFLYGL